MNHSQIEILIIIIQTFNPKLDLVFIIFKVKNIYILFNIFKFFIFRLKN
jgi:hypothetical protein